MNKLKKVFLSSIYFLLIISLVGCSFGNTPTKKVENFLDRYQQNDDVVLSQLKEMITSDSLMDEEQKEAYSDIIKKQYKDLTYVIKDEKIEGNKATVTAEIEVYDFYKANKEAEDYYNNNKSEFNTIETVNETDGISDDVKEGLENGVENAKDAAIDAGEAVKDSAEKAAENITSEAKYINYRLDRLKEVKDRVKYTIDFTLTKEDGNWAIDDIDDITRQKIHGLYEH